MKGLGNKLMIFSLGILMGVIAGGAIVWFVFGSEGKNIYIFNNSPKKEQAVESESDKNNIKSQKENYKRSNSTAQSPEAESASNQMDLANTKEQNSNAGDFDFVENNKSKMDSGSANFLNEVSEEVIVVRKDELLYSKYVQLTDLNLGNESVSKRDSMLQYNAGIKEYPTNTSYIVEYWKSPINYKGYKTNKNKIVLFGLIEAEKPKLYKLGDEIYLKNNDKSYKIKKSADYSAYEVVTDVSVLSKFN